MLQVSPCHDLVTFGNYALYAISYFWAIDPNLFSIVVFIKCST